MRMIHKVMGLALCLALVFAVAGVAVAEDIVLEGTLSDVVQATDRNGNPYVRAIIQEERELKGVKYEAGTPLMFFGDTVSVGNTLKKGDSIKAIVTPRMFQGRKSYTFLKAIE
jgi:hypothetical protein